MTDIPDSQSPPKVKGAPALPPSPPAPGTPASADAPGEDPPNARNARYVVDIVFLMDATASMGPCIHGLKKNISTFVDSMCDTTNQENPVRDWRAKVVGYRDFKEDPATALEDNLFVESVDELRVQLNNLEAKGGGDEPESLLEGIMHVAGMDQTDKGSELDPNKWRYRSSAARVVIIFTDASYHEEMEEPYKGGDFMDVANACYDKRLILQIFCPEMECYNKFSEIERSVVTQIPYDEDKEEGAINALREFTGDKNNWREGTLPPLEAVKWAQANLGVMYDNGQGVPKDEKERVKMYRKAAEKNDAIAQYRLGKMYENGRGVEKDFKEAIKWYRKAAEQGYEPAKAALKETEK